MKTLILFDIDGTLIYSERSDSMAFATAYEDIYQKPFPSIDWKTYPHVTDQTIFAAVIDQHFSRAVATEEIPIFRKRYMELLKHNRQSQPEIHCIVDGATELLRFLEQENGFELGFATGGWEDPAYLKLDFVGISTNGHVLVGADGKATREEILSEAITQIKTRNNGNLGRVVYIGDAIWDVNTTRNLQLDFVGIRYRGDAEELLQAGAKEVIQDYRDIPAVLESILRAEVPE